MHKPLKETRQKFDLPHHHSLCEVNYARLLSLIPHYKEQDFFQFSVSYNSCSEKACNTLIITVLQRAPYTTRIGIKLEGLWGRWIAEPELDVQLYHDILMAEVTMAQQIKRLPLGIESLNSGICQPNEKLFLSQFLSELLDFCIQGGHVAGSVFCPA